MFAFLDRESPIFSNSMNKRNSVALDHTLSHRNYPLMGLKPSGSALGQVKINTLILLPIRPSYEWYQRRAVHQ